eukprot:scaffold12990_cov99-Isochrysis_galbana.AAC.9
MEVGAGDRGKEGVNGVAAAKAQRFGQQGRVGKGWRDTAFARVASRMRGHAAGVAGGLVSQRWHKGANGRRSLMSWEFVQRRVCATHRGWRWTGLRPPPAL